MVAPDVALQFSVNWVVVASGSVDVEPRVVVAIDTLPGAKSSQPDVLTLDQIKRDLPPGKTVDGFAMSVAYGWRTGGVEVGVGVGFGDTGSCVGVGVGVGVGEGVDGGGGGGIGGNVRHAEFCPGLL